MWVCAWHRTETCSLKSSWIREFPGSPVVTTSVAVRRKEEKSEFFFSFPFTENKDKQNSEQAWTFLVFSTLTASNSACQYLSLLFGPLTLRSYTSHLFSFDRMLNTSCVWYLSLQHPSPCNYISERRLKSHQMARINHWVTDSSLWLSLKQCKRKNSSS